MKIIRIHEYTQIHELRIKKLNQASNAFLKDGAFL